MQQETFWDFVRLAFEGWIGQVVLILLALMFAGAAGLTINRICQYSAARKDAAHFSQRVGLALSNHELEDLISIARGYDSPRAIVIAAGLVAFQGSGLTGSEEHSFEAARRASKLSARAVHFRLSSGLSPVAAIIATSVFVGGFGTCYHMLTGFKGGVGSIESLHAAFAYEHSRALVPTAWSFLIAVLTTWAHRYLEHDMNSFDLEMETASLDLMNYLAKCPKRVELKADIGPAQA